MSSLFYASKQDHIFRRGLYLHQAVQGCHRRLFAAVCDGSRAGNDREAKGGTDIKRLTLHKIIYDLL